MSDGKPWNYEADLGVDHKRYRQAAGNLGPFASEGELTEAVTAVMGTTLESLRTNPKFGEYPEGTGGVAPTTLVTGATLTRYTDAGTDDDWRIDI